MGSDIITDYGLNIICLVGVSISLAVSLNLINGYTGQFSLGHAGFMAVGAYTAASITTFLGPKVLPLLGGANSPFATSTLFVCALFSGGLVAALSGLFVGVPCLRLKGDYLAI